MTGAAHAIDLAQRLGANPARWGSFVLLHQNGRMRLDHPARGQLGFSARQVISVTSCAFSWRAKLLPFGLLEMTESLLWAKGQSQTTAFGIVPLHRVRPSAATGLKQVLRYMSDLPLAPDAILHNPALRWRSIDKSCLVASTGSGAGLAEVVFALDAEGRIASAITGAGLPLKDGVSVVLRQDFSDYRQSQGRWLPFAITQSRLTDGAMVETARSTLHDWAQVAPPAYSGSAVTGLTILTQGKGA